MLGDILTYEEFKTIVEHCKTCMSGDGIKHFIRKVHKSFEKANPDFIIELLEYITKQYPSLNEDYELAMQEFDPINFTEEYPDNENIEIEFLISVLMNISDGNLTYNTNDSVKNYVSDRNEINDNKDDNKVLNDNNGDVKNEIFDFDPKLKNSILEKLLNNLQEAEICQFSSVDKVTWVFSNKNKRATDEKLKWINCAKENKRPEYRSFFYFLELMLNVDLNSISKPFKFCSEVNTRLQFGEETEKKTDSIRKTLSRFLQDKGKDKNGLNALHYINVKNASKLNAGK